MDRARIWGDPKDVARLRDLIPAGFVRNGRLPNLL